MDLVITVIAFIIVWNSSEFHLRLQGDALTPPTRKNCCHAPPGILIGTTNSDNTVLYIVAVVHLPVTPKNLNSYLEGHNCLKKFDNSCNDVRLYPLGIWIPVQHSKRYDGSFSELVPRLFAQKSWVVIEGSMDPVKGLSFSVEHSEISSSSDNNIFSRGELIRTNTDNLLVLYDQKEIWDGEFSDTTLLKSDVEASSIEALFAVTRRCKDGILSYESGLNLPEGVSVTHCCVHRELSLVFFLLSVFTTFALTCLHMLLNTIQKIRKKIPRGIRWILRQLVKVAQFSSFCCHAGKRSSLFCKSLDTLFGNRTALRKRCSIAHYNVIASVFADIMLGLMLLAILQYFDILWSVGTMKEVFLPYVDGIAKQMEELIKWLMGIPAGLKLNSPLNQFLGHFFLYHVRLWLEYAKMMMGFFPHLITYCLMSSCLGLSFFLSVVADAVSTLSFHVYCFYVYAGRLYGLQVSGLMSLWRLFRGKKWNPLRKRVDSLEDSGQRADQLFVGTLFFTVLLFLLPTTALYYGIFTLLRITVLAMQIILSSLVLVFSEFPSYSFALRLFQPHKFIESVNISWLDATMELDVPLESHKCERSDLKLGEAISVQMRVESMSLLRVVKSGLSEKRLPPGESSGMKDLMKKIVVGDLVRWS